MHVYDNNEFFVTWLEEKMFDVSEEDVYITILISRKPQ